jgi:DNA replication protein DnaC
MNEDRGTKFQKLFFPKHPRFWGASLSHLRFSDEINSKISKWIKKPKNMLVLQGRPGVGKTYLCAALVAYFMNNPTGIQHLRYYDEASLFSKLREAIAQNREFHRELEYALDYDCVIFNDMGSDTSNDWRKDVVFNAIDYMYNCMKPFIVTTNLTREEIVENYGERTASRLFAKENTLIRAFDADDLREEGL